MAKKPSVRIEYKVFGKDDNEFYNAALRFKTAAEEMPGATVAAANDLGPEMVSFAKANAPWTDRTGDARRGLHAVVTQVAGAVRLTLAYTVFYGKFLEQNAGGKYAIVLPTVEMYARRLKELAASNVVACLKGRGSQFKDVPTGRFT